jgi:hypothetical protein
MEFPMSNVDKNKNAEPADRPDKAYGGVPRELGHRKPVDIDGVLARWQARCAADHAKFEREYRERHADDVVEEDDPGDLSTVDKSKPRKRRPSVASLIKEARKAGARGPVRVELPDGTKITASDEPTGLDLAHDDDETPETLRKLIQ